MSDTTLVDQVAHLLGRSAEEVRPQVEALVEQFRDAIDREGEIALEGLGTFRRSGEQLSFVPDRELLDIVDPVHAGLPALETSPASGGFTATRPTSQGAPRMSRPSVSPGAATGSSARETPSPYELRHEALSGPVAPPSPASAEPPLPGRVVPDPKADREPAAPAPPYASAPAPPRDRDRTRTSAWRPPAGPAPASPSRVASAEPPAAAGDEKRPSPHGDLEEQKRFVENYDRQRARSRSERKKRERRVFMQEVFFLVFVIVSVLVVVAWFTFGYMGDQEAAPPQSPEVATLQPGTPQGGGASAAASTPVDSSEAGADPAVSAPPPPAGSGGEAGADPPEPAGGTDAAPEVQAFGPEDGSYVWAVASEPTRDGAERLLRRFASADLPGEVIPAVIDGRTWYRVTLGRFQTRAAAEAARGRLPEDVPDDAYVRSIR